MPDEDQRRWETILMSYESKGLENFLSDETTQMRNAIKDVFARHPQVYCDAVYNSAKKYWVSFRPSSLEGLSIYMAVKETEKETHLELALRDLIGSIGKPSSHFPPLKGIDRILDLFPRYTTKKAHEILLRIENET
jgi:hypothetical protein